MKASLVNYRQAPRKTRLVTELIKGKSVSEAMIALKFLNKRAATPILKLLASAAANAEKQGEDMRQLYIQNVTVNKGIVMKRSMARAFGRGATIRHRTSHVSLTLGKGTGKASRKAIKAAMKSAAPVPKEAKKAPKKASPKK